VVTKYRISGSEIDVRIRQDEKSLTYLDDLKNISIATASGSRIPLSEVAEITLGDDRWPSTGTTSSGTLPSTLPSTEGIFTRCRGYLRTQKNYPMPSGYAGSLPARGSDVQFHQLPDACASSGAAARVYGHGGPFQKYLNPFIIMFSVPLALSGGLFGLFVSGCRFRYPAHGLVMLVGMVVNNAILLIDYTDQLRAGGFACREALVESGATRIRPILMTTLTTVLGLLPMAVTNVSGTELAKPLAIVTIFGMMFSLFVTLIFIPSVYLY
jgi:HAE1 family hydrophobic/amphiphilic exporter-1